MRRIYLDNAATSWPKPESVYLAIDRYQRENGASAGRSAYAEAVEAQHAVETARLRAAQLLGVNDPRRIVFGCNGTDSLNMAIHGSLAPGDHVITTDAEHNSVLRPLRFLEERGDITVTRVPCDMEGLVDSHQIKNALRAETKLVAITHASNVTGRRQPLEEIGAEVRRHDALFLVDAAQTLGHMTVHVDDLQADFVACSGHKGLLGPLGTGILYVGPRADEGLRSVRQGGTGTQSEDDHQPSALPERMESGNVNVPGLVGLTAGIDYLTEQGLDKIRAHESRLLDQLVDGLRSIRNVTLYVPSDPANRMSVLSIAIAGHDPHEISAALDVGYGIQVRSGLHCAPRMHRTMGTDKLGGTVRFSIGAFNTSEDIDAVVGAVNAIASAALPA